MFKSVKFMDADEKMRVYVAWKRFVNGGFKFTQFSQTLYNHLMQHCDFIAHYNRAGFYATYFEQPDTTQDFMDQFNRDKGCNSVEYGGFGWMNRSDYADINNAMIDYWTSVKDKYNIEDMFEGREVVVQEWRRKF